MHRLPLSILCVCCGLALFHSSCKKQNGTTSKGGPVSNAQKQKNGPSVIGPKSNIRNKLKQVAGNSKQAYLNPQFVDRAVSLDLQFKPYRDDVPERSYFPEVMGAGIEWVLKIAHFVGGLPGAVQPVSAAPTMASITRVQTQLSPFGYFVLPAWKTCMAEEAV